MRSVVRSITLCGFGDLIVSDINPILTEEGSLVAEIELNETFKTPKRPSKGMMTFFIT